MPVQTRRTSKDPALASGSRAAAAAVSCIEDSGETRPRSVRRKASHGQVGQEEDESDDDEGGPSLAEGSEDEEGISSGSGMEDDHSEELEDIHQASQQDEQTRSPPPATSSRPSSDTTPLVGTKAPKYSYSSSSSSSSSSLTSVPATSYASTSQDRLDPSVFADYFASTRPSGSILKSCLKKTTSTSTSVDPPTQEELRAARQERTDRKLAAKRRRERRGGIVVGRDGRAMKRLKDGRTIVRSLEEQTVQKETKGKGKGKGKSQQRVQIEGTIQEEQQQQLPEEIYLPSSASSRAPEDQTNALAIQKSKRFLKRKLGLGNPALSNRNGMVAGQQSKKKKKKTTTTTTTSAASADDPLGLEDPAFLPGGEFAHLANLTGKRKRNNRGRATTVGGTKKVKKSDLRTDALRTLPGSRIGGAAIAFNRSSR